jgi:hypothetical protein
MLLNSSKRRKAANPRVQKQASLKSFKLAADVAYLSTMAFIISGEIGTFLLIVGLQRFADSKKFDKILLSKGF